ncbi:sensor histidine kinase [Caldicellulosiruptoraceae bacterium PP1]
MKSIYVKMVSIYTILVTIGFLLFGFILNNLVEYYFIQQKQNQLLNEAEKISSSFALWYVTGIVDRDRFRFEMNFLEDYLNASIIMINKNANIVLQSDRLINLKPEFIKKTRDIIFSSNIVSKRTTPIGSSEEHYVVGYPVIVNNQVIAGLLLTTSINQISKTLDIFNRIVWVITLFEIVLVLIITYILTQKITLPIKKLALVSRKVAEGDFNQIIDVKITSEDEIGELIKSFNYMTEKLKNLEYMRRSFIANVSHELRSPLTSIRGFLEGILDGTIPEAKHEYYLSIIKEETIKLNNLINQLLELSRLEWGKINLNISQFKLHSLVAEELISFEKRIEEKNLYIDFNIDEKLVVLGDRELIGRVIHNLIDNAIKYNKKDGSIIFSCEVIDKQAFISIEDTGVGIPDEMQKFIWERFYKVDESRSLENGVGLGLSIVKEIIKLHNQNIWVESKVGYGTKFTFTLNTQ